MKWVTTSLILEKLQHNDAETWKLFLERFRQPIVIFANNLGLSFEEAEDAAQETLTAFLTAYRNGKYDRSQGRLGSWLFGIAHRTVLSRRRKVAHDRNRQPAGQRTAFWDALPAEEIIRQSWDETWQRTIFEQCIRQVKIELEPNTVHAFEMYVLNDRPVDEVAAELGMTRNAVYKAKHRVLTRMRELQDQIDVIE